VIKRTIEISREPAHLCVRHKQLLLNRGEDTVASIPCEDLGVVVVEHPLTTYSHAALNAMADAQAVLVICDPCHLPKAMMLPLGDHSELVRRLRQQVTASLPLQKQLWKQIVQAKISAQAANLAAGSPAHRRLTEMVNEVRSGDPTNCEAQASRIYWIHWLGEISTVGERFRRDADMPGINSLLNYGYAIVRAAIARAIVVAGLHPAFGLKHHNRSNAYCLADDLIEPLRPLVDSRVREFARDGRLELDQPAKAALLELLTAEMQFRDETGPLLVSLSRMVASLVACYAGESRRLEIPEPCKSADTARCGS
jgi:CRISPR-associated protein Cas1